MLRCVLVIHGFVCLFCGVAKRKQLHYIILCTNLQCYNDTTIILCFLSYHNNIVFQYGAIKVKWVILHTELFYYNLLSAL